MKNSSFVYRIIGYHPSFSAIFLAALLAGLFIPVVELYAGTRVIALVGPLFGYLYLFIGVANLVSPADSSSFGPRHFLSVGAKGVAAHLLGTLLILRVVYMFRSNRRQTKSLDTK